MGVRQQRFRSIADTRCSQSAAEVALVRARKPATTVIWAYETHAQAFPIHAQPQIHPPFPLYVCVPRRLRFVE
jgi:hypothetical protein